MIITKILGVKIKIDTDYNPFESFLLNNFTNEKSSNTDVKFHLKISFDKKIFSRNTVLSNAPKIYLGSDIYIENSSIYWNSKKLKILLEKKSDTYYINAYASYRIDQKIRKIFIKNAEFDNNLFLYVYRFAILYPIIATLNNDRHTSLIHASAVHNKKTKKSIIFVGLNGVGKSSLSFQLKNLGKYDLLSDNFVLIEKNNLIPVPELLRLPTDINLDYNKSLVVGKANNKLLLKNKKLIEKSTVEKVVFVSRKDNNTESELVTISKDKALDLLTNIGFYLKEYENFHYTSFIENKKLNIDEKNYKYLTDNTKNYLYKIGNEKNSAIKFLQLLND